jgi:membrane protein insertase Oxa1/YidC/SpoIIIJ
MSTLSKKYNFTALCHPIVLTGKLLIGLPHALRSSVSLIVKVFICSAKYVYDKTV